MLNNMEEVKRIDIKEFREIGFLQELNRQFLHPLGMALEIILDEETKEEKLGGVWDYRDDKEGMMFNETLNTTDTLKKAENVNKLMQEKAKYRTKNLGFIIQPLPKKEDLRE